MGIQKIQHKSRGFNPKVKIPAGGDSGWWRQEGDAEIYDVILENIAEYKIGGNNINLPFDVTNGNLYTVSITKNAKDLPASIKFFTRRSTEKNIEINIPNYASNDGRYLYVLTNSYIYKYDTGLLTSTNYAGNGLWLTTPLVESITMPDISLELDQSGAAGKIKWTSICFVTIEGISYIFCLADSSASGNLGDNQIASLMRLSDNSFLKSDRSDIGYTRLYSKYSQNGRTGALIYDYINQKIIIQQTRAAASGAVLYDLVTGLRIKTYAFGSPFDNALNKFGGYKFRFSFDPFSSEFITHLVRINELESNRNYMGNDACDSTYIRATGEVAVVFYNNNSIRYYSQEGKINRTAVAGSAAGASGGGFIMNDETNNYITWAPRDNNHVRIVNIDGSNGFSLQLQNTTADHNGFRGVMKSKYSGHFFTWGRIGTNSGKRLYVLNGNKRDSELEVGYIDFPAEIEDMFTNQIL